MFGDYKSYKAHYPAYSEWKQNRDLMNAKREEYLRKNPTDFDLDDLQRSKTILRAIDVMDEYSQKRAEDTEVATETVISYGLELALTLGGILGVVLSQLKPIKNFLAKHFTGKNANIKSMAVGGIAGGLVGTIAAFPLFAWAARAEAKASRKGRFEAMRKELNNPKTFAVLTPEQEARLNENLAVLSTQKEKKNPFKNVKEGWYTVKEMVVDSPEYVYQKMLFEEELIKDAAHFDKELTAKEIEDAKRDQQLMTKLVEKIDIASQDYAENAELATSALITTGFAFSGLFTFAYEKLAKAMKWKVSSVPSIVGTLAMLGATIYAASMQKQAARVGRFKAKQDLMKNPSQLVYVRDDKTNEITDVEVKQEKKVNIFKFLLEAGKNNKEFKKWQKTEGAREKNLSKALENIELTDEQYKDAIRLQHNTFKTFNKVDEKSQKYSESLEALGQAIQYPLSLIFSAVGIAFGLRFLKGVDKAKTAAEMSLPMMKYMSVVFLSTLPSILINAFITKEQKKASRVADMLAINEMQDYKNFVDYSRFKA